MSMFKSLKQLFGKKTGNISLYLVVSFVLIAFIFSYMYQTKHMKEGITPSQNIIEKPTKEDSSSTPKPSSPDSSRPDSLPTFDVNSPASFALLEQGEMLNPSPSASTISSTPPTNWYQPGSFRVPFAPKDTTDTIFMNQSTNLSQVTPVQSNTVGFCSEQSNFPLVKESKCNALSNDTCASTECCVLLGGEKCVAGNEQGPLIETNYSNFLIKNRDYYYYQGKCYGNCGNQ